MFVLFCFDVSRKTHYIFSDGHLIDRGQLLGLWSRQSTIIMKTSLCCKLLYSKVFWITYILHSHVTPNHYSCVFSLKDIHTSQQTLFPWLVYSVASKLHIMCLAKIFWTLDIVADCSQYGGHDHVSIERYIKGTGHSLQGLMYQWPQRKELKLILYHQFNQLNFHTKESVKRSAKLKECWVWQNTTSIWYLVKQTVIYYIWPTGFRRTSANLKLYEGATYFLHIWTWLLFEINNCREIFPGQNLS